MNTNILTLYMSVICLLLGTTAATADSPIPADQAIPDGYMVIEGDIIVPDDFLTSRAVYNTNLWTCGIVPYEFNANVTPTNQSLMLAAMAEWEAVANVTFVPHNGDPNYIHIQASTGNNSFVGMIGGRQVMNIVSWTFRFIMAHELGHALGFWHEQSRSDRDTYVQINTANIQSGFESNFDIRSQALVYGPYDFDSVMHYHRCAFSTCCAAGTFCNCPSNCQTITVLPPNEAWQNLIGQIDHLSSGDQNAMAFVYGGIIGQDCNNNGICDYIDIFVGTSVDCSNNGIPDECEIDVNSTAPGGPFFCTANCDPDCNNNGIPDECDIASGVSADCQPNGIPDECDLDANSNGIPDACEITAILRVLQTATGAGNGSSWENAFTDLQAALDAARAATAIAEEIWVAAGVYKPVGPGGSQAITFETVEIWSNVVDRV